MKNVLCLLALTISALPLVAAEPESSGENAKDMRQELKGYRHKIVYESNRDGNWELYLVNADGSNPINLTKTPDVDEFYAKASPDGLQICFCADEGKTDAKSRNLYIMKSDGTGRTKFADNAREPCWSSDGQSIAFLKGEFDTLNFQDYATKGIFIYDLKTGQTREHPNKKIQHLYCLNWSPDGKWFVATVHAGMGFKHSILAIEANGDKVVDLKLEGCRPDLSPDGKRIVWGHGDCAVGMADLDFSGSEPKAVGIHNIVETKDPIETYHADWSPDGRYIAFSHGPKLKKRTLKGFLPEIPGIDAPEWNLCVADAANKSRWVMLTTDGKSNKEPDWVYVKDEAGK